MPKSTHRGHEIANFGNGWYYADTGEPVASTPKPCGHCGKGDAPEGHDACLGTLPGVMNACCGHGDIKEAYVQFPDASCIRGEEAIKFFKDSKGDEDGRQRDCTNEF